MVKIPKPEKRMKTVAAQMERCIYYNDCSQCWLKSDSKCQEKLMGAGLWYLQQALEKSAKMSAEVRVYEDA